MDRGCVLHGNAVTLCQRYTMQVPAPQCWCRLLHVALATCCGACPQIHAMSTKYASLVCAPSDQMLVKLDHQGTALQDFRDVEGDKLMGRKTLPILYGYKSRVMVAAATAALALCSLSLLLLNSSALAVATIAASFAMHMLLAVRVLQDRGAAEDHRTYKLLDYLYWIVWGSSALWLQAPLA